MNFFLAVVLGGKNILPFPDVEVKVKRKFAKVVCLKPCGNQKGTRVENISRSAKKQNDEITLIRPSDPIPMQCTGGPDVIRKCKLVNQEHIDKMRLSFQQVQK